MVLLMMRFWTGMRVGVRVLASLAGHRSIPVTRQYIDVNNDMKRNAVELI
jgi:integrase/recombinase XerD